MQLIKNYHALSLFLVAFKESSIKFSNFQKSIVNPKIQKDLS